MSDLGANITDRLDVQPGLNQPVDIQDVVEEFAIRTLVTQLSQYYGEGVTPHFVHPNLQKLYVSLLDNLGFSMIGRRALNPMLGLESWDKITAPFASESIADDMLIVGPPGGDGAANPAEVVIYARSENYWKARREPHIDTNVGYSANTVPEQVPWDEKLSLVKILIGKGYVPKRRFAGVDSGIDYVLPPRTVEDLARVGGAHPREVLELLGHIREDDFVVGPIPKFDPKTDSYIGLEEGPAVAFWGPADMTEAIQTTYSVSSGVRETIRVPSIDAIRLARLKIALENETIQA